VKDKPLVSVVVMTKNAEESLRECLESIRRQSYSNIELIVVDNYSTDRSREIAKEYGAVVYVKGPERSAQLNYGGRMAKGEFVYFLGSDIVLTPGLVEECVKIVSDGCDAVIIWNVSDPSKSVWARARFYERFSYYGSGVYEGARFVRRDIFLRVGGFDEDIFANEDIAFGRKLLRLGVKIGRTKHNYELHIGEPRSLREIVLKSYYYGGNIRRYFRKYGDYGYALPIRPTFFKRKFVKKIWKEWPQGIILIPFCKLLQSTLYLFGLIVMPKTSPYERK
jgi:glycosyltransferase involved in cell wall biosynthesis